MQLNRERRRFIIGSGYSSAALASGVTLTASAAEPTAASKRIEYPSANDFAGILTLNPDQLSAGLLWQAGAEPFDCIRLQFAVSGQQPHISLCKNHLGSGRTDLSAPIQRGAQARVAFRVSATTGLELFVNGQRLAQATTPSAKMSLSLPGNDLQAATSAGSSHVLLFNEGTV